MTLITVITTTRDNLDSLKATGKSLKQQNTDTFEWLIYDGSRSDERDSIEGYAGQMSSALSCDVRYAFGLDDGFYLAAESALSYASGAYVLFLNAGDLLAGKDTLFRICDELTTYAPEILHGQNIYVNAEGGTELHTGLPAVQMLANIDRDLRYLYYPDMVCQQAIVYHKDVFNRFGFSKEFSIAADHEHFLRCARAGVNMRYWPHPLCVYFAGGFSFSYIQNCKLEWLRVQLDQVIAGCEDQDDCTAKVFKTLEAYLPAIGDGIT